MQALAGPKQRDSPRNMSDEAILGVLDKTSEIMVVKTSREAQTNLSSLLDGFEV